MIPPRLASGQHAAYFTLPLRLRSVRRSCLIACPYEVFSSDRLELLSEQNYRCEVAAGFHAAKRVILDYLQDAADRAATF